MKRGVGSVRVCGLILALISLFGLGVAAAFGQAIDGSVVGTVVDTQGAAIVGAEVSATNIATNVGATGKTSGSGEYRFDHLLAGTYKITVKMTGFKMTTENVVISLNQTVTRNVTLTPGAATETVEVSGVPPVLDTTTAQLQSTYESKVIADSPLASVGSGVINLSLMDAGVASSGGVGLGTGPSISGQRPRNNNFTIEGVDNNSKSVTGPSASDSRTTRSISSRCCRTSFRRSLGTPRAGSSTRRSSRARTASTGECMSIFRTGI